jgi:hypothetical protein
MDGERHLHWNISTGFWNFVFLVVLIPVMKLLVDKLPIPGPAALVHKAFGA